MVFTESTPISLKPDKSAKKQRQAWCRARTKAGRPCQAPAVERGLCFFHANPERLAELGRQGGRKNRRWEPEPPGVTQKPLKSVADVGALLEETINKIRSGPFDLRAANAIGFLAGNLLKALEKGRTEQRLAHLEALVGCKGGADIEAFDFRPVKEQTHEQPSAATEGD